MARVVRCDAIVLAGGPADAVAQRQPGAPNKAFVEIAGKTLVARVLGPLRASASIGRIVVVAPPEVRGRPDLAGADDVRPDGRRITDSLRNGLADFDPAAAVLIVASDLPVLTVPAVDDFAARAAALNADVVYGCVERSVHMARFPEVPHTWARMRDGTFCGGGIAAIKPRAFPLLERFIERLGAARKHPIRLASLFGWEVLLRFAVRQLSVAQAEARATQLLGAPVRALVSPFAETAVNVDRVTDIALAEELVKCCSTFSTPR
ncbi:MAG TPA: NTP transferase domain-containing protein [Candidatus Baltobacteraceae bacterium]|nr:NTP transferase domain-containing protein [Candidatus Baltobacteraceae bacterium]